MLTPPTFTLTKDEQDLLGDISFDLAATRDKGVSAVQQNGRLVASLYELLRGRMAIPAARLRWFEDPECFPGGRGASRRSAFSANARGDENMLVHPHFVSYLRYFLYGPDLPEGVIRSFKQTVESCRPVTSGDLETLRKTSRSLARTYCQHDAGTDDEFHKLALEAGLTPHFAQSIRTAVREALRRK